MCLQLSMRTQNALQPALKATDEPKPWVVGNVKVQPVLLLPIQHPIQILCTTYITYSAKFRPYMSVQAQIRDNEVSLVFYGNAWVAEVEDDFPGAVLIKKHAAALML